MSATPIFDAIRAQAWRKKMIKEVIANVLWSSLSNRVEATSQVPNAGQRKIPDSVVFWVTDDFKMGIQKTTIPFLDKLNEFGQGGWQKVEGEEETPEMRFKTISYNIQRKAIAVVDESVEGDMTEYYSVPSHQVQELTDYFSELTDYNFQRATLRGADEFLTEAKYWTGGSTLVTAPVAAAYHPNWLVAGASGPVAFSAVDATYGAAIQLAMNALTTADTFSLASLDSMIHQADRSNGVKLQKLAWKSGDKSVQYVGKLSETQSQQLTTETGAGTWRELMSEAGKRGVDNRAISGVIGVYKRTLWITDERAPLWDATTATDDTARIQFFRGPNDLRLPTVKGAGSGTCEMAVMCGRGMIGAAKIKDLDFISKDFDYGFSHGLAAQQSCGFERMDLLNDGATGKPLNQSSFVYGTATPATVL